MDTRKRASVEGVVIDAERGSRLSDAKLGTYGGPKLARSDSRGEYLIPELPEGSYRFVCEVAGYEPYVTDSVKAESGRRTRLVCRPRPLKPPRLDEPVALLPMRLELKRILAGERRARVAWSTASLSSESASVPLGFAEFSAAERQYWLRWYPDDCHLRSYVSCVRSEEAAAWQRFENARDLALAEAVEELALTGVELERARKFVKAQVGLLDVHDLEQVRAADVERRKLIESAGRGVRPELGDEDRVNPKLRAAWQLLVQEVGPVRARYLARRARDAAWTFDECLPFRVSATYAAELDQAEFPCALRADFDVQLWAPLPEKVQVKVVESGRRWSLVGTGARYFLTLEGDQLVVEGEQDADTPLARFLQGGLSIPTLPERVHLFVVHGPTASPLVRDIAVDVGSIRLGPDHLARSRWQTDFDEAVRVGMGIKISDPGLVSRIDSADWIFLTGAAEREQSRAALADVLARRNANGELSLLPQDCATNNVEYRSTEHTEQETDDAYLDGTLTRLELGARLADELSDAELIARALGVDPKVFSEMRGAELSESLEASVMRFLVGLPCFVRNPHFMRLDADRMATLIHFGQHVAAAGPLPVLRVGSNPYGVLPVLSSRDYKPEDATGFQARAARTALILKRAFLAGPARETPKLDAASDREQYDVLVRILNQAAVSNRVSVRELTGGDPRDEDAKHLWCPLVAGNDGEISYLKDFADGVAFGELEASWPLLKRLLYSLPSLPSRADLRVAEHTGHLAPSAISSELVRDLARIAARLSVARLEVLLMETLDLLSHRVDAWLTSFAWTRLQEVSAKPRAALGVYGWLERPGEAAIHDERVQFLQAPSMQQALTAAVLKNASDYGSSEDRETFSVNLSSERVRLAAEYYAAIRAGHGVAEVLGTFLQDAMRAAMASDSSISELDILTLQERYPLKLQEARDAAGQQTAPLTLIDGAQFLERETDPRFSRFRDGLARVVDAAGDLAIFEACDQLFRGNAMRAAAWLDCQDGTNPPPELSSIASRRSGPLHSTRVSMILGLPDSALTAGATATARGVASPELAWFSEQILADFSSRQIIVQIEPRTGSLPRQVLVAPADLGFTPLDLLLGAEAELELRARYYVLAQWAGFDATNPASPYAVLGERPAFTGAEPLLSLVKVRLELDADDTFCISTHLNRARDVRELLRQQQNDQGVQRALLKELPPLQEELASSDHAELLERFSARSQRIVAAGLGAVRALGRTVQPLCMVLFLRDQLQHASKLVGQFERTFPDQTPEERTLRASELLLTLSGIHRDFAEPHLTGDTTTAIDDAIEQSQSILSAPLSEAAEVVTARRALDGALKALNGNLATLTGTFLAGLANGMQQARQFGILEALMPLPPEGDAESASALAKHALFVMDQAILRLNAASEIGVTAVADAELAARLLSKWAELVQKLGTANTEAELARVLRLSVEQAERFLDLAGEPVSAVQALNALWDSVADEESWIWPEHERLRGLARLRALAPELEAVLGGTSVLSDVVEPEQVAPAQALLDGFAAMRATSFSSYFDELLGRETDRAAGWLQALTDGAALSVLRTFRRREDAGVRPEWSPAVSALPQVRLPGARPAPPPITSIEACGPLRPALATAFRLFARQAETSTFEDLRPPSPLQSHEASSDTDWIHIVSGAHPFSAVAALHIDSWEEGHPGETEETALAFRYPSAHAEAPNAILLAVPPRASNEPWTPELLANVLLETVELAELRMTSSRAMIESGLGALLPAAIVAEPPGVPLFPTQPMLLLELLTNERIVYALSSELTDAELGSAEFVAVRSAKRIKDA